MPAERIGPLGIEIEPDDAPFYPGILPSQKPEIERPYAPGPQIDDYRRYPEDRTPESNRDDRSPDGTVIIDNIVDYTIKLQAQLG